MAATGGKRALGQVVVGDLLKTAAIRYQDRESTICTETGRRFTFSQVNERANRLGNGLIGLGLKKGDIVAFLSTNRAEIIEIYFALSKAGLIGIPLNYRLASVEMISLMKDIGADALIAESKYSEVVERTRSELPKVRIRVGFGDEPLKAGGDVKDYEALLAASSGAEPDVEVFEYDPCYFNLTSGTTGLPKCYLISQYNNANHASMFNTMDMSRKDTVATVFPMFGRVGFAWTAASMMWGTKNVIMNFEPGKFLELVKDEGITIVNLVPTMGSMLLQHPDLPKSDLSSLRAIVYAGSLLPAPVREATQAKICKAIYEYYGMQESGALVATTPDDRLLAPNSVGRPILFAHARVVDANAKDLPVGETGEIIGRSTGTVTEYFQNPEKSAETFKNGWLHTGDLGYFDKLGFLYINGRLKDLIVTGGQNVHAGEVEALIGKLPSVTECSVVGLPDDFWGESVTAVVVRKDGETLEAEEVIAYCRQSLAGFKTPKRVIFQDAPLPRTATGKVQKFMLVDKYKGTKS